MPLFFASNALYPVHLMPGWLQFLSVLNPLSYEVDALRGLLVGAPCNLPLDLTVLLLTLLVGVVASSSLLDRLAR
jgi:ABC-2 type transport system permease protein